MALKRQFACIDAVSFYFDFFIRFTLDRSINPYRCFISLVRLLSYSINPNTNQVFYSFSTSFIV